jgi:hypothetical protein
MICYNKKEFEKKRLRALFSSIPVPALSVLIIEGDRKV